MLHRRVGEGSRTAVEQPPQVETPVEGLVLPDSTLVRVKNLLQALKGSGMLSPQLLKQMAEWEEKFASDFISLSTDEERVRAAADLCCLLFDVVEKGWLGPEGQRFPEKFEEFESLLKSLIQETLPKAVPLEEFLRRCEQLFDKATEAEEKFSVLETYVQTAIEQAYTLEKGAREKVQAVFTAAMSQLLQIENQRTRVSDEMHGRICALRQKIIDASHGLAEKEGRCRTLEEQADAAASARDRVKQDIFNTATGK